MIDKNSFEITRRDLFLGLTVMGFSVGLGVPIHAFAMNSDQADGLLHLRENGKIDIYSGGGHHGAYAQQDTLGTIAEILAFGEDKLVIVTGGNPEQLPGFLTQNSHHMTFASNKTNRKAARILRSEISCHSKQRNSIPRFIIEKGVSETTHKMIDGLKPEGIIVAVRPVIR